MPFATESPTASRALSLAVHTASRTPSPAVPRGELMALFQFDFFGGDGEAFGIKSQTSTPLGTQRSVATPAASSLAPPQRVATTEVYDEFGVLVDGVDLPPPLTPRPERKCYDNAP